MADRVGGRRGYRDLPVLGDRAGAWLVLALGAWIRVRLGDGLRARVAVIGSREFAADFAAELSAAGIEKYEVVGWVGGQGPADYRRLRWLGPLDGRSRRGDRRGRRPAGLCADGCRRRRRLDRGRLRAGRRRVPRSAGAADRGQPALRGGLRSRPGRDDRRGVVPLHHASAVPGLGADLEAGLRPLLRHADRAVLPAVARGRGDGDQARRRGPGALPAAAARRVRPRVRDPQAAHDAGRRRARRPAVGRAPTTIG